MKKLLVIASACLSLMVAKADAYVSIALDALTLLEGGSGTDPVPSSTLVLFVVDTSANGISTSDLTTGISLAPGASIGDDVVVERLDCTVIGDGYVQAFMHFIPDANWVNKPVGIIWFPGLTIADNTLVMTTLGKYGSYTGGSSPLWRDPWFMPGDGGNLELVLDTTEGDPQASGYATHNVIPEPSTITLVGLGLLGLFGMMRRRRREEQGK